MLPEKKQVLIVDDEPNLRKILAAQLSRDGYDVWLHHSGQSNSTEAIDGVAAEARALGRAADVLAFDIADRTACAHALKAQIEARGAPYGVVLNAGIARDYVFPALSGVCLKSIASCS